MSQHEAQQCEGEEADTVSALASLSMVPEDSVECSSESPPEKNENAEQPMEES